MPAHPVSRLVGFTLRSAQTCFSTTSLEAAYSPPRAHGRGRRAGRLPTSSTSPSRPASASPSAALSVPGPAGRSSRRLWLWPLRVGGAVTTQRCLCDRQRLAASAARSQGARNALNPAAIDDLAIDRRSRRRSRWPPIPSHRRGAVRRSRARTVGSFGCPECESWADRPLFAGDRALRRSSIATAALRQSRSGPSARQQGRRRRALRQKSQRQRI